MGRLDLRFHPAIPATTAANNPNTIQASRPRFPAVAAAGAAALVSVIHLKSRITSEGDCHRSSGSLARQVLTTWSNAGGDIV